MIYVKKWLRTRHAFIFRLSNKTIQVHFHDHTEIILSSEARYRPPPTSVQPLRTRVPPGVPTLAQPPPALAPRPSLAQPASTCSSMSRVLGTPRHGCEPGPRVHPTPPPSTRRSTPAGARRDVHGQEEAARHLPPCQHPVAARPRQAPQVRPRSLSHNTHTPAASTWT